GRAEVRPGMGQIARDPHRVLHLVGVEEAESLVDICRNATALQGRLELAMAVARSEQDRHVRGLRIAAKARRPIADDGAGEQTHDLPGDLIGGVTYARCREKLNGITVRLSLDGGGSVCG